MKYPISRILILLFTFTISVSDALPFAASGMLLSVHGKAAGRSAFVNVRNGRLTLIDIHSKAEPKTGLQFFAYLKRNGKIVPIDAYTHHLPVRSIGLAEISKSAQVGDDIIIELADISGSGRKLIYVRYAMLFPPTDLFPFSKKNKGGC